MRLLTTTLLAAALVLLGTGTASAFRTDMITSYNDSLTVSDSFTVTVLFDSEGAIGTMLLSVGVEYDTTYLQYMGNTSQSYMLYTPAVFMSQPAAWIAPAPSNGTIWGGTSPAPPIQKVNLDWIGSGFPSVGTFVSTADDGYSDALGTLTFHIIANGDTSIDLNTSGDGNVLQLGDASIVANTAGASIQIVPEPSVALLFGVSVAAVGLAHRRRSA
jgi:hypothetical protein